MHAVWLPQRIINHTISEVVNEILTNASIEMIETVFVDWVNQLQRLIDRNGDYVS
jgi:hypothetical protein